MIIKKINIKLLVIFIAAFFIRLIALNQSLWLDETTTARVVQQYNYLQILRVFSPHDFHPPLFYWLEKFWTNIFGYSEVSLRMPSVIFSLATGYFVYLIAGIWGAVFFLFNPLIVYYSQEARMYMMATFFLTMALYYFLKIQKKSQFQIIFGLFCALAFLTFYGSVFLIAAFLLYFLYKKQYKFFFVSFSIFLVSLIIVSPLLYQQLINAKESLTGVKNWSLVLGKANLKDLLLIPVKFSIGRIDFYPKWLYYAIAGGWTIFIISQISNFKSQNQISNLKSNNLFIYLLVLPLILGFFVSFVAPLLQYFRFIYLIPIMAILLVRKNATVYCYTVAAGFLVFSLVYLSLPQFYREDWKSLVKSLPNDKPVYMITASSDPVKYYDNSLIVKELTNLKVNELKKEIIVIPYTAEIYGVNYKDILFKNNYKLIKEKAFRGLTFETYSL